MAYREQMNAHGSPSESVAAGYRWAPGTELARTNGHEKRPTRGQEERTR